MGRTDNLLPASKVLDTILNVVNVAELAIGQGEQAVAEFDALATRLKAFKASNTDPTAADFQTLMDETDSLSARLDADAAKLG